MAPAITKDLKAFKREYNETGQVKRAMLAAGYAESTARTGTKYLPQHLQRYLDRKHRKLNKLAALGESVNAETQERLMRGAIFDNIISGKDKATNSIRLGMQDKRVSMLQNESVTGVIVIQPPPQMMSAIQERIQTLAGPNQPQIVTVKAENSLGESDKE